MEKQRSATLLVLMLLLICAGWWSVSFYQLPQGQAGNVAAVAGAPVQDANYQLPQSLAIDHARAGGQDIYSGSLLLPSCDTFATTITSNGADPVHVTLAFVVLAYPACTAGEATTSPFSVSFGGSSNTSPTLDGVTINGAPVKALVTERS